MLALSVNNNDRPAIGLNLLTIFALVLKSYPIGIATPYIYVRIKQDSIPNFGIGR